MHAPPRSRRFFTASTGVKSSDETPLPSVGRVAAATRGKGAVLSTPSRGEKVPRDGGVSVWWAAAAAQLQTEGAARAGRAWSIPRVEPVAVFWRHAPTQNTPTQTGVVQEFYTWA